MGGDHQNLSEAQRASLLRGEELWREAEEIVRQDPQRDIRNVYLALRNFDMTPDERLARGLLKTPPGARRVPFGVRLARFWSWLTSRNS